MEQTVYRFSLDLQKQDSQKFVNVRRWDTIYVLSILLVESGTPYNIAEGTTVTMAASKPGETVKYVSCTVEEDNRVSVTLPTDITNTPGMWTAFLRLTGGGETLSTPAYTISVDYPFVS